MTTETAPATDLLSRGTLTIKRAIDEFGLSRSRIYVLMQCGSLPYSQIGSRRLIPRVALERLIAANLIGASRQG